MSQALNEIQEFLTSSDANPVDINDLLVFLPILPEDVLQKLAETFKEDPETIVNFVVNFKSKLTVLTGSQGESWSNIEDEEGGDNFDNEDGGEVDDFEENF